MAQAQSIIYVAVCNVETVVPPFRVSFRWIVQVLFIGCVYKISAVS